MELAMAFASRANRMDLRARAKLGAKLRRARPLRGSSLIRLSVSYARIRIEGHLARGREARPPGRSSQPTRRRHALYRYPLLQPARGERGGAHGARLLGADHLLDSSADARLLGRERGAHLARLWREGAGTRRLAHASIDSRRRRPRGAHGPLFANHAPCDRRNARSRGPSL